MFRTGNNIKTNIITYRTKLNQGSVFHLQVYTFIFALPDYLLLKLLDFNLKAYIINNQSIAYLIGYSKSFLVAISTQY